MYNQGYSNGSTGGFGSPAGSSPGAPRFGAQQPDQSGYDARSSTLPVPGGISYSSSSAGYPQQPVQQPHHRPHPQPPQQQQQSYTSQQGPAGGYNAQQQQPYARQPPQQHQQQQQQQQPNWNQWAPAGVNEQMLNVGGTMAKSFISSNMARYQPGVHGFWTSLKYYFAVDNSYVRKKLTILLLPVVKKGWHRAPSDELIAGEDSAAKFQVTLHFILRIVQVRSLQLAIAMQAAHA
jgi:YIF1